MKNRNIEDINPDIGHLEKTAKTYFYVLDKMKEPQEAINKIYILWRDMFDKANKNVPSVIFMDSEYVYQTFKEDYLDNIHTALRTAWALGYDFGENNPQKARELLFVDNHYSNFIPQKVQENLTLLGDYAAMVTLYIMHYLHNLEFISDAEIIKGIDATRMVHKDGIFTLFKNGINYFYAN